VALDSSLSPDFLEVGSSMEALLVYDPYTGIKLCTYVHLTNLAS